MMNLNIANGDFQFYNQTFSAKDKLNELKRSYSSKELELWTSHNQWESYRLNISDNYIIILMFFNDSIKYLEIFPKVTDENNIDNALGKIMTLFGGEKKYQWGKVELNNDIKAGYKSIMITYE